MTRVVLCDICKKPTTEIAHKLLLTPSATRGVAMHSSYTHHADVGICCAGRIKLMFNFKERRTREQYNADRKKRAGFPKKVEKVERSANGDSVATGKKRVKAKS